MSEATLRAMIRASYPEYDLPGQIAGGPSWLDTDRFDVEAKTDPSRTSAEMEKMSQALLAERFGLTLHSELRELPVYFLERDGSDRPLGMGLRTPEINCDDYRAARARGEPIPKELYRLRGSTSVRSNHADSQSWTWALNRWRHIDRRSREPAVRADWSSSHRSHRIVGCLRHRIGLQARDAGVA